MRPVIPPEMVARLTSSLHGTTTATTTITGGTAHVFRRFHPSSLRSDLGHPQIMVTCENKPRRESAVRSCQWASIQRGCDSLPLRKDVLRRCPSTTKITRPMSYTYYSSPFLRCCPSAGQARRNSSCILRHGSPPVSLYRPRSWLPHGTGLWPTSASNNTVSQVRRATALMVRSRAGGNVRESSKDGSLAATRYRCRRSSLDHR